MSTFLADHPTLTTLAAGLLFTAALTVFSAVWKTSTPTAERAASGHPAAVVSLLAIVATIAATCFVDNRANHSEAADLTRKVNNTYGLHLKHVPTRSPQLTQVGDTMRLCAMNDAKTGLFCESTDGEFSELPRLQRIAPQAPPATS